MSAQVPEPSFNPPTSFPPEAPAPVFSGQRTPGAASAPLPGTGGTGTVPRTPGSLTARYRDLGPVGSGGMGEVRRVFDRELERVLAMKIVADALPERADATRRFVSEARITGRLQHPGIIPVHDAGRLDDGRLFYTMRLVEGHTLREVIATLHRAGPVMGTSPEALSGTAAAGAVGPAFSEGAGLRPVIEAFHKVCEAVAFAHSHGIVHRDLKPSNVMVGGFGEVLVVDWGLAQAVTPQPREANDLSTQPLMGTPAYMAPEVARREPGAGGPEADVYALGAVLYEILSGRPPYVGGDPGVILAQVLAGPPPPPRPLRVPSTQTTRGFSGPSPATVSAGGASQRSFSRRESTPREVLVARPEAGVPSPLATTAFPPLNVLMGETLVSACTRAMARDPHERFPDASSLASAINGWLEGSQRRRHAAELVERCEPLLQSRKMLAEQAAELREQALEQLSHLEPWRPLADKRAGWTLQEQAQQLQMHADAAEAAWLEGLQAALVHDPDLPEAHRLLASYYRDEHAAAEARRDARVAARYERMLRAHDREGLHQGYLRGESLLSLSSDPPGARVTLWQLEPHELRLVPSHPAVLGRTPLQAVPVGLGSWLLHLEAPGFPLVRYPVWIGRQRPWTCQPPGVSASSELEWPIRLLADLGSDDVYVPEGWFQKGGDPLVTDPIPATWSWLPGFVIKKFPVTNGEYLRFLNAMLKQAGEARALSLAPRERVTGQAGNVSLPIYHRAPDGHFILGPDADGDEWRPEMPVVHVDLPSAQAYAEWFGALTGLPWTLPTEDQWEKAGRGVDGRAFPWGEQFDPTFARVADSAPGRVTIADVTDFPLDESIYGVRGLAGNVQDWCLDVWRPRSLAGLTYASVGGRSTDDPLLPRVMRGGAWRGSPVFSRLAERSWARPTARAPSLGFRLLRPL